MISTKNIRDAEAKHVFTPSIVHIDIDIINYSMFLPPLCLKCKSAIIVVEDDCKDSVGTDSKKDSNGQNPSLWKFVMKMEISLS